MSVHIIMKVNKISMPANVINQRSPFQPTILSINTVSRMAKQRKSVPGNMSLGVLRRLPRSSVATKSRAHPQLMFHSRRRCFSPVTSLRSLAAVLRTLRMRVNRLSSCSLARYSRSSWCVLCPGAVAGRLVTGSGGSLIIRPPLVLHGVRHRSSVRVGV